MPVLDGPGMAYLMLMHDAGLERIPVILISGIPDLRQVATRVGTTYFLSKPYRLEQLQRVLARALLEQKPLQARVF
jgi:FixJ family two-component response regulator